MDGPTGQNGISLAHLSPDEKPSVPLDSQGSKEERGSRGNWTGQLDFLLSCIGFAVGLGNLWRFPYLCMRNGGGAFLIPYFFFLLVSGIPLFIMELAIGQFSSSGPITIWNICPLFRGLGWGMVIISLLCTTYYQTIISWVLYYLAMSFTTGELPWASCNHTWNTENCSENHRLRWDNVTDPGWGNVTELTNFSAMVKDELRTSTEAIIPFYLNNSSNVTRKMVSPSEEFWQNHVLELTDDIGNIGGLKWQLVLCHIGGWIIMFLCLIKGIKSAGKVVYVTATAPYLFLTILLIRACMLPGAAEGIKYFITPDFSKLADLRIWFEACLQIFYSLGPGWGGMITYASYNKFHHNCYRDGIIISLVNCGTSFYGGFVVFSVIGVMAHEAGVKVQDAMTSGPGLVFIAYPEALTKFPLAPLWSVFFFLMLLTLGMDSQFAMSEAFISGLVDQFPNIFKRRRHKQILLAVFVIINGIAGLIFYTRAGMYFFQIWDWFFGAFGIILIAAFEALVVSWLYGVNRLISDLAYMTGHKLCFGYKVLWGIVIPFLMLFCFFYTAATFTAPSYGSYTYPGWAIGFGWFLAALSMIPIPVFWILELLGRDGSFMQRLRDSAKPSPKWGPALAEHRKEYGYPCLQEKSDKKILSPFVRDGNEESDLC